MGSGQTDICDERGSNGYRRITAHLNRHLRVEQHAIARVNSKRVYRVMRQNNLLLRKYPLWQEEKQAA